MPRHKEPESVTHWRNGYIQPRICHTCEHYSQEGICQNYNMEPPEDFAKSEGECQEWLDEIPF